MRPSVTGCAVVVLGALACLRLACWVKVFTPKMAVSLGSDGVCGLCVVFVGAVAGLGRAGTVDPCLASLCHLLCLAASTLLEPWGRSELDWVAVFS